MQRLQVCAREVAESRSTEYSLSAFTAGPHSGWRSNRDREQRVERNDTVPLEHVGIGPGFVGSIQQSFCISHSVKENELSSRRIDG